jgi:polar amino acid transport system substrate-binding protein
MFFIHSATPWCAKRLFSTISLVAGLTGIVWAQSESQVPRYRHIDPAVVEPAELPQGIVRLLVDSDFAPFSFSASDGSQAGFSVEMARAACAELRLACEIVPKPFAELLPALQRGEGDVIVTGARLDATIVKSVDTTRPYFVSTGRFFIHRDTKLADTSIRTLAGKRLGYVRGTLYGAFMEQNYGRSSLLPFESSEAMFRGLQAKELDVAFSDSLYSHYWLKGPAAAGCCITLGAAFIDRNTFSRGLTFLARKDRKNLRESLDYALDRLEEKGITAKLIARYVPGPVW